MHLVEILLPLTDDDGRPFAPALYADLRRELVARFGGLTAFTRAPAEGLWEEPDGGTARDEIVIVEVMAETLDRDWWADLRRRIEQGFEQDEIVIRARGIERL